MVPPLETHSTPWSRVDDLLETFEEGWRPDRPYITEFVSHHADCSLEAICELVRVDLDRRYASGIDVDLEGYLSNFPRLRTSEELLSKICFEDFRSRKSRGLDTSRERWERYLPRCRDSWWLQVARTSISASTISRTSAPSESPQIGQNFGDFYLVQRLGAGAFSEVFLATQPGLANRYVVLKVVRRVFDEPTHLARLQHTGIVPLYSMHRMGPYTALCMPYCGPATLEDCLGGDCRGSLSDGQSLVQTIRDAEHRVTQLLNEEALAESTHRPIRMPGQDPVQRELLDYVATMRRDEFALWFARRIASALAHAHSRNVVHGDVKPANILIRNDGEPALIDFNLAHDHTSVGSQNVGGTIPYMSPEQLRGLLGRESRIDASSDVFATGVVLYMMSEGRHPYGAPSSMAESDIEQTLRRWRETTPDVPKSMSPGLWSIVRKCLSFEASDRYHDATQMSLELERESLQLPLLNTREPILTSRIPKWVRRNPRLWKGMTVVLSCLTLMIALAGAYQWRSTANQLQASHISHGFQRDWNYSLNFLEVPLHGSWDEVATSVDQQLAALILQEQPSEPTLDGMLKSAIWSRLSDASCSELMIAAGDYALTSAFLSLEASAGLPSKTRASLDRWSRMYLSLTQGKKSSFLHLWKESWESMDDGPWDSERFLRAVDSRTLEGWTNTERLLTARAYYRSERFDEALATLETCVPESHTSVLYWTIVGDIQKQRGEYASSYRSYSKAIQRAPRNAVMRLRRAALSEWMQRWQDALDDYGQITEILGEKSTILADSARSHEQLQHLEKAMDCIDRALTIDPDSVRLKLMRSRLLLKSGEIDAARRTYLDSMQQQPSSAMDWVSRGLARLPDHPELALADLQIAKSLEPLRFEILQNLAHVYSEFLHDEVASLEHLDQILAHWPHNEMARAGRCVVHARLRHIPDAIQDIQFLEQRFNLLQPATQYQIGCAYALLARDQESYLSPSIQALSKAIVRGYGADILEDDVDLQQLRNTTEYESLRELARLLNADSFSRDDHANNHSASAE